MQTPSKPKDEEQRLQRLRKLNLLDTPPEARFDRITTIAKRLFNVPIALFTLVDEKRQWFKSCVGIEGKETSREVSFCGHAILEDSIFEIADTFQDSRFADNPLVTGYPFIRFYAGYPVSLLDGSIVGTLCLIDTKPRKLEETQRQLLEDLGALLQEQLHYIEVRQLRHDLGQNKLEMVRLELCETVNKALSPMIQGLSNNIEALVNSNPDKILSSTQQAPLQAIKELQNIVVQIQSTLHPEQLTQLFSEEKAADKPDMEQSVINTFSNESFEPSNFKGSILIVDDEPFVLKTTAFAIKDMGFKQVLTAQSGQQVLDQLLLPTCDINLMLIDINMPDMNGIELLRRLHDVNYIGDILVFSGEDQNTLSMVSDLAKARGLSVLGSISKPIQKDMLLKVLSERTVQQEQKTISKPAIQITPALLEEAIKAGELEPWFQPKIDVTTRQPVAVEMLARWPKGPYGPVYPDEFIPVAESCGLINPLTFMLISQAVEIEREWRKQGLQLKIAANLSMKSLEALDFPEQLENMVDQVGGSLESFQLEVTESSLREELVTPLDVLLRLHLKRVRLSIDDFGTGHSNLTQLRDLPFDELKLDRSYVRSVSQRGQVILESSVDIAKKLGMQTVAEGVETLEDWQRVEELGCDMVQGWFCAKAMPAGDIPQWVKNWEELRQKLFN